MNPCSPGDTDRARTSLEASDPRPAQKRDDDPNSPVMAFGGTRQGGTRPGGRPVCPATLSRRVAPVDKVGVGVRAGARPTKSCSGAGCAMRSMTLGRASWPHVRDGSRRRVPCRGDPAGPRRARCRTAGAGRPVRPATRSAPSSPASPAMGRADQAVLVIRAGQRDGVDGYWTKAFPVTGGRHYRFDARYRAKGVDVPRRSVVAEIHWRDAEGRHVPLDEPAVSGYLRARPRWPRRSSPRRGGTTARAGPRSPTPTGPHRGRPGRSSSCTCAGPRAARCAGATSP